MSTNVDKLNLPRCFSETPTAQQFNELAAKLEQWAEKIRLKVQELATFVSLP